MITFSVGAQLSKNHLDKKCRFVASLVLTYLISPNLCPIFFLFRSAVCLLGRENSLVSRDAEFLH